MAGALEHSPADILSRLLVTLGLGTTKSDNSDWPIVPNYEPDTPDNAITVFDTEGRISGRLQISGRQMDQHGIQVRIRSQLPNEGYAKANDIVVIVDETIDKHNVTIGANTYCVNTFLRTSGVISLGKEEDNKRTIHVFNGRVIIKKLA